jgi:hypothetical protein
MFRRKRFLTWFPPTSTVWTLGIREGIAEEVLGLFDAGLPIQYNNVAWVSVGYKGIPFTKFRHARDRQRERGVSDQDIREVLDSPDVDLPSASHPGRRVLRKKLSKKVEVGVVIIPPKTQGDPVRVVTAWIR